MVLKQKLESLMLISHQKEEVNIKKQSINFIVRKTSVTQGKWKGNNDKEQKLVKNEAAIFKRQRII